MQEKGPDSSVFYSYADKSNNATRRKKVRMPDRRHPDEEKCDNRGYFVTRSSHFTIASMTTIERPQTTTKTPHVAEMEMWL